MTSHPVHPLPAGVMPAQGACSARRPPRWQALRSAAAAAPLAALLGMGSPGPAQAALVAYEITGTLTRAQTSGSGLEAYVAGVGFDGGAFAATVRLDTGTQDIDARPGEARFFGAVVESTLRVGANLMAGSFCSPDATLLDCSVAVSNDAPIALNLLSDSYRLSSQVFKPAGPVELLPADLITFLKYDLSTLVVALGSIGPSLLTGTEIDPGLDTLPGLVFDLGLRTLGAPTGTPNIFWTSNDLAIRRLEAPGAPVPEPATLGLACLALAGLSLACRRDGRASVRASGKKEPAA